MIDLFSVVVAVCVGLACCRRLNRPRTHRSQRPNIILVLTDDQDIELGSMEFMPKTSAILKDGGASLRHAYVSTPMCCPSRSSLLTGLYTHNHDVYTNNDNCSSPRWQRDFESRTFATYLNDVGYRTAYFGKYLNEYKGTHIPVGWREWSALVRNSRFYNYTINTNGAKIRHGELYGADYYPDLITNESLAFFRRSKRELNKPIMMVMSYPSPHGPEDAAPQYQHLFANVTTHRTKSWNYAPNSDKQWILRHTGQMEPVHIKFTDMLHQKRLQTLQTIDSAVEQLWQEVVKAGEENNTYIFYTSDHGYHLGQFGLVKGKAMPFEFDVRVPFFVRGPGIEPGSTIENIVVNIDLAPTFLDIAGVPTPEHMDGRSFYPLLLKQENQHLQTPWRDSILLEKGKISKDMLQTVSRIGTPHNAAMKCSSGRYPSPCLPRQKWECIFERGSWTMKRCLVEEYIDEDKQEDTSCACSGESKWDSGFEVDPEFRHVQRKLVAQRRRYLRQQQQFYRRMKRIQRNINGNVTEEPMHKIARVMPRRMNETTLPKSNCFQIANQSILCYDDTYPDMQKWRQKKDSLDKLIRKFRDKLDELKGIRRYLKMKRPRTGSRNDACVCTPKDYLLADNRAAKRHQVFDVESGHAHPRRLDKKSRRRGKFLNTTCNAEKMNCFTHDNDHWKTPPYWTYGPFCFCQNANNNTFWCIRTVNATHNFLYCEFVTGYVTYYDMTTDPDQLKNVISELSYHQIEEIRHSLNRLRRCKGSRECNVRYKPYHSGPRAGHRGAHTRGSLRRVINW